MGVKSVKCKIEFFDGKLESEYGKLGIIRVLVDDWQWKKIGGRL